MLNRFVEIPGLHQSGLYPRRAKNPPEERKRLRKKPWNCPFSESRSLLWQKLQGYRDLPGWPIDIDTWMRPGCEDFESTVMSLQPRCFERRLAESGARIGKVGRNSTSLSSGCLTSIAQQ